WDELVLLQRGQGCDRGHDPQAQRDGVIGTGVLSYTAASTLSLWLVGTMHSRLHGARAANGCCRAPASRGDPAGPQGPRTPSVPALRRRTVANPDAAAGTQDLCGALRSDVHRIPRKIANVGADGARVRAALVDQARVPRIPRVRVAAALGKAAAVAAGLEHSWIGPEADAQSPESGRPGMLRQWVRLSAMILVDCIADWLRLANSMMSRWTRSAWSCNPIFNVSSSSMSRSISCTAFSDTPSTSVPRLSTVLSSCGIGSARRSASAVALLSLPFH